MEIEIHWDRKKGEKETITLDGPYSVPTEIETRWTSATGKNALTLRASATTKDMHGHVTLALSYLNTGKAKKAGAREGLAEIKWNHGEKFGTASWSDAHDADKWDVNEEKIVKITYVSGTSSALIAEQARRLNLWSTLKGNGAELTAGLLREIGIYGGAQGIWVNLEVTRFLVPGGVAVSILHTGRHYPDDVSDDGLVYHYPNTGRSEGRDKAEVQALKTANELQLPIFVITPGSTSRFRHVALGWVVDWDDQAQQFLVLTGEAKPTYSSDQDSEAPFNLTGGAKSGTSRAKTRPGQAAFRFKVLDRYGSKCAVCTITQLPLIKAAHICGKAHNGSDDWRNGIPLCSTHHDAFDAHMFVINPITYEIVLRPGLSHREIGITETSLVTLRCAPHVEALEWRNAFTAEAWKK